GLEPGVETMCDLDCFVPRVFGRQNAVHALLRSLKRKVAMELNHSVVSLYCIGTVDLNFVVVLPKGWSNQQDSSRADADCRPHNKETPFRKGNVARLMICWATKRRIQGGERQPPLSVIGGQRPKWNFGQRKRLAATRQELLRDYLLGCQICRGGTCLR